MVSLTIEKAKKKKTQFTLITFSVKTKSDATAYIISSSAMMLLPSSH
jgi:hypothetical protein